MSSNSSTHEATQFGDSICPVCVSTFKCLFNMAQPMGSLINTGGGYHLEALNFRSDHSSFFPSSILLFPLFALPSLQLCHSFDHLAKPHRTSIDRRALSRVDSNHSTSTVAYTTKHSVLSLSFFHRCKQNGLVRVFLVQLGFY